MLDVRFWLASSVLTPENEAALHFSVVSAMSTEFRSRLADAGWILTCERYIEIDLRGESKQDQRRCTWRAVKGADEVVVIGKFGHEHAALAELYAQAKSIDPDLQQIALQAGSGAWIIDLTSVETAAAESGRATGDANR